MEFRTGSAGSGRTYLLSQSQRSQHIVAGVLIAMGVAMFFAGNSREWYGVALPLIPLGIAAYLWLTAEGYASEIDLGGRQVRIARQIGRAVEHRSIAFDDIAAVQCAKVWFINNQAARLPSVALRMRLSDGELVTMGYAYDHAEVLVAASTIARGIGVPLEQSTEERRI